jgi:3'(2'), 5'-bisphosphate nucleotidase
LSHVHALAGLRLLEALTEIARQASAAIEDIRSGPMQVRHKADSSPITAADEAAHHVILAGLERVLPGIPVISEETAEDARPNIATGTFVLVDPLDGTREFIAGSGEFTVNIALIEKHEPVAGVVAAPALGTTWRGARGYGAERLHLASGERQIMPIRVRAWPAHDPVALVSRSHLDPETEQLLQRLGSPRRESCGSSVKFCRVAEGAADLYPRLARTSEWDLAAGHAVLAAAGGVVIDLTGRPLRYGNAAAGFRIDAFIAAGDRAAAERAAEFARP